MSEWKPDYGQPFPQTSVYTAKLDLVYRGPEYPEPDEYDDTGKVVRYVAGAVVMRVEAVRDWESEGVWPGPVVRVCPSWRTPGRRTGGIHAAVATEAGPGGEHGGWDGPPGERLRFPAGGRQGPGHEHRHVSGNSDRRGFSEPWAIRGQRSLDRMHHASHGMDREEQQDRRPVSPRHPPQWTGRLLHRDTALTRMGRCFYWNPLAQPAPPVEENGEVGF